MDFNTFMNSNAGRQAVKQYESEVAAQRAALIEEKQAAREQRDQALREINPQLEAATATANELRAALSKAEAEQRRLETRMGNIKASCTAQLRRCDKALIETAPAEIDQFCERLEAECGELQRSGVTVSTDRKRSNRSSLERRLRALRAAIGAAQNLKTQAVVDLPAELEALRAALPEVQLEPAE